jgi:oligopeptide transport system substrate-binding protein
MILRNLVIICSFFLLFSSCRESKNKLASSDKTVFRYNEANSITSLDPAFCKDQANIWAVNQLFNGLVQINDKMEIEPCIAKSWEISPDGLIYTFHLRKDVYFHDNELFHNGKGRRVSASDFEYSFFRIVDRHIASPGAWVFNNLSKSAKNNFYGFEARDDSTFIINLEKPFPPFLGLLTMQYCSVVPIEIVENYGKDFRNHPVGTGPFQFSLWKEGSKLILKKNNHYFEFENGKRLPYLDAVSVSFLPDKQTAFMEFIQNHLDFLSGLDASYKDEIITKHGKLQARYQDKLKMETLPYLNTEYLGILVDPKNPVVKESPLKMKAIRQAINYGFDRKKMITYLRNNLGTPAMGGIVPKGLPSYNEALVKGYSYNPEKAKKLLADAGFPNGAGLPEITLNTTAGYLDLCEFMQSQLSQIGIKVKLDVSPSGTLREMIARSKVGFFRGSWIADYPDAENYLALFYSPNFSPMGPNYTHFSDPEFDKLYDKSQVAKNDSIRYMYFQKMENIILEAAPIVPLYYDEVARFYQNSITGLGNNPMNLLTLKRVKKKLDAE